MPITPCCLPSSILRNYCQMFNKFRVNKVIVHYITSSPTSQAGDVLFYYEKDRLAPMADYSSSSFLPYVLSDPHTVIGPQWTNHSAVIRRRRIGKPRYTGTNPISMKMLKELSSFSARQIQPTAPATC
jgi:hypothetical protein